MGCEPDEWAKEWLAERRKKGETGLTVEKKGSVHYLKWATTVWDPETKKRRKVSEYKGVLNRDGTVAEPRPRRGREMIEIGAVKDSGNARLLAKASDHFLEDLEFAFRRDHPEIVELAFARCLGRGELSKAGKCWKNLDDVLGLRPNTSPKALSGSLERIGRARGSQDMFFDRIRTDDRETAVDMSVIFSRAKGAMLLKRGYNRFRSSHTQLNLLLTCGLDTGRPQYMAVLPGNAKEGSAVLMLDEFDISEGTVLIMDRGYCDKDFLGKVTEKKLEFVVAAKRNSKAYDRIKTGEGMFRWKRSAVSYGHGEFDGMWAYRFENLTNRNDELVDALAAAERGSPRVPNTGKAGNFMILSSKEMEPKAVYSMYKRRCMIEKHFDTAKNILSADRMYMQDDAHMLGHLFVTFVSLLIWMSVEDIIDKADMTGQLSVSDVLDTYGTMKSISSPGIEIRQSVPKDVRDLDEKLGLYLFTEPKTVGKKGQP
jgi:hypothetical protein